MTERINTDEYVELEEDFIVLAVPSDSVEIEIKSKFYEDGEIHEAKRTIGFSEVRRMFQEARDGYIPSNAVFSLRPVGKDKIEALLKKYIDEDDEI